MALVRVAACLLPSAHEPIGLSRMSKRTLDEPRHFSTTLGTTSGRDLQVPARTVSLPPQANPQGRESEIAEETDLAACFPPHWTSEHAASTPFSWLTAFESRTQSLTPAG